MMPYPHNQAPAIANKASALWQTGPDGQIMAHNTKVDK